MKLRSPHFMAMKFSPQSTTTASAVSRSRRPRPAGSAAAPLDCTACAASICACTRWASAMSPGVSGLKRSTARGRPEASSATYTAAQCSTACSSPAPRTLVCTSIARPMLVSPVKARWARTSTRSPGCTGRRKCALPTKAVTQSLCAQALAQALPASSTQASTLPPEMRPPAWGLWEWATKRSVMVCMGRGRTGPERQCQSVNNELFGLGLTSPRRRARDRCRWRDRPPSRAAPPGR